MIRKYGDISNRFFFALVLFTSPYGALTNEYSVAAKTIIFDGWMGRATLFGFVAIGILIIIDAVLNAFPGNEGWKWARSKRVFLYLSGAWLSCVVAYTPSKYESIAGSSLYLYSVLALWGITLAVIDLYARGWAPRAAHSA